MLFAKVINAVANINIAKKMVIDDITNLTQSYRNNTLGLDIHYPSNWTVITTECKPVGNGPCYGTTFIQPINNLGNQSVVLEYMFPRNISTENTSLKEQSINIIKHDNQSNTDFILIDSKQIANINGNPAWTIEYVFNPLECNGVGAQAFCTHYQEPGSPYEHVLYTLIEKSGKLYVFKYFSDLEHELAFYKNLGIARDIVASFKPLI